jgi:hypothetical protein
VTDIEDLTAELRAVRHMLGVVVERLEASERRANRQRMWTLMLALTVLVASGTGAYFVKDSRAERERICTAMRVGFDIYTDALVAASDKPDLTDAEQEARDEQVRDFRRRVLAGMAGCS